MNIEIWSLEGKNSIYDQAFYYLSKAIGKYIIFLYQIYFDFIDGAVSAK